MAYESLQRLVRRRLWELGVTADEASRRSRGIVPSGVIERMASLGGTSFIREGLAHHLARALGVPENRVRRAAGLPQIHDPRANITTRPHLTLVGRRD